jgi:hypothetical protein
MYGNVLGNGNVGESHELKDTSACIPAEVRELYLLDEILGISVLVPIAILRFAIIIQLEREAGQIKC